jgi:hypothetical protein
MTTEEERDELTIIQELLGIATFLGKLLGRNNGSTNEFIYWDAQPEGGDDDDDEWQIALYFSPQVKVVINFKGTLLDSHPRRWAICDDATIYQIVGYCAVRDIPCEYSELPATMKSHVFYG